LPIGSANGVDFTPLVFPRVEENDFQQLARRPPTFRLDRLTDLISLLGAKQK